MSRRDRENNSIKDDGLKLDPGALRGRQSVRATFRLPVQVIELLTVAASQLGVQQKSLFDQLLEDRAVLRGIARAKRGGDPTSRERHQKTMVLSRRSLEALNETAKKQRVARDLLVEAAIRRLMPVMTAEQQKQAVRKHLLESMTAHRDAAAGILARAEKLLGRDDPVYDEINRMTEGCSLAVEGVGGIVEKGKCLERITGCENPEPRERGGPDDS
jgi:hypothetical protein